MTLDHLSFGTHDIAATRAFYGGKLGFPVLIHERMLMQEGGTVEHIFFDCGGGCALAFMQWQGVPGVPSDRWAIQLKRRSREADWGALLAEVVGCGDCL
ncbi:MAG: VOC family protein [Nodosilinea sp.]|jgi:catechol 2,3-dioxygenase-like lactoylglutathione lyase family enzyme